MKITFFRNKDNPDLYLIHKGNNNEDIEILLHIMNHTGEYEDSGFPKINVEIAYFFITEENSDFFEYLADVVATECIKDPIYNDESFKAWYKFKIYEPEKWISDYLEIKKLKEASLIKLFRPITQMELF